MADRVHCPSAVVDDQHRHVEAPKHAREAEGEVEQRREREVREDIEPGSFPGFAVGNLAHVRGVTERALTERSRLADEPHHMRIRETVARTVDVFFGIGLQMVIAMITDPGHGIAGETDGRTEGEDKLEPARHFKPAMGEIAMEIERGAETDPEIDRDQERQERPLEAGPDCGHAEELEQHEDAEYTDIKLFVFEHNRTAESG